MQLLLIRHALPVLSRVTEGRADPALAEEGRVQAARLPDALAPYRIRRIFSSPQRRALETAGPLAVSAEDCGVVWRAIQGFDPDDPLSRPDVPVDAPATVERLRIALPRTFFEHADEAVADAVRAVAGVLEGMGVQVDEVEGPDLEAASRAWVAIGIPEVADVFRDLWDDDRVAEPIRGWIAAGRTRPSRPARPAGARRAARGRSSTRWTRSCRTGRRRPRRRCTDRGTPRPPRSGSAGGRGSRRPRPWDRPASG